MYIKNKIRFLFPSLFLAGFISFAASFFNGAAEYKQGQMEYEMLRDISVERDNLTEEKQGVKRRQEIKKGQGIQEKEKTQEIQKKEKVQKTPGIQETKENEEAEKIQQSPGINQNNDCSRIPENAQTNKQSKAEQKKQNKKRTDYCTIQQRMIPQNHLKKSHQNHRKNKLSKTRFTSISTTDEALKAQNTDYRFWLKIPETSIDYPVVKSPQSEYYLNHTFLEAANSTGCLFIQNDQQEEDENFVVYGHNRKDGSMFGELKKYLDQDFYEIHPHLWVRYEGRWYKGAIFSCQLIENQNLMCYEAQFSTRQQKEEYMNKMKEASRYPIPVYPSWKDPLITLSTCYGSSKRMIVQAALMCYTE